MTKASAKKPKRSHMVTEAYLAAWADERNVLDVLDVQKGNGFPSALANASVSNYVYKAAVLSDDLEERYGVIEGAGLSAIKKLREGGTALDPQEVEAIIAFLDMHYLRGQYADRADDTQDAVAVQVDMATGAFTSRDTELMLGDMLQLLAQHTDRLRLTDLALETWAWNIVGGWEQLLTGDSAALIWSMDPASDRITSITFPLSPTQLLVIGEDIPASAMPNVEVVAKCRRWIFGQKGTLPTLKAEKLAELKRAEEAKRAGA